MTVGYRNGSVRGVTVATMNLKRLVNRVLQSQSDSTQNVRASMAGPVWHNVYCWAATYHLSKAEHTECHFDDCQNLVGKYLCLDNQYCECSALVEQPIEQPSNG